VNFCFLQRATGFFYTQHDKVARDQVLFLKHNLNANAIAALQQEFAEICFDISQLIQAMEKSIAEANHYVHILVEHKNQPADNSDSMIGYSGCGKLYCSLYGSQATVLPLPAKKGTAIILYA
jgi:hypothetical protein